jgi:hypothetical protein
MVGVEPQTREEELSVVHANVEVMAVNNGHVKIMGGRPVRESQVSMNDALLIHKSQSSPPLSK